MVDIIITTTGSIENRPVKKYIDVICSNIVIGTNIFSDLSASFVDLVGGKSESYQKKLQVMYHEVIKDVKHKALAMGANAILSLRVDFDEISGGNKSMFMVSASGTACIVELNKEDVDNLDVKSSVVNVNELENELYKRCVISGVKKGYLISNESFEYLLENPQDELCDNLIARYIDFNKDSNAYKDEINNLIHLLGRISFEPLCTAVYNQVEGEEKMMSNLINKLNLFVPDKVLELCKAGKIEFVLSILDSHAPFYDKTSVDGMMDIYRLLTSLPDKGKIEIVKSGLLGKESEKYICPKGHKSSPDSTFCEDFSCGLNINGLTKKEVRAINDFKEKIDTLTCMIR